MQTWQRLSIVKTPIMPKKVKGKRDDAK